MDIGSKIKDLAQHGTQNHKSLCNYLLLCCQMKAFTVLLHVSERKDLNMVENYVLKIYHDVLHFQMACFKTGLCFSHWISTEQVSLDQTKLLHEHLRKLTDT